MRKTSRVGAESRSPSQHLKYSTLEVKSAPTLERNIGRCGLGWAVEPSGLVGCVGVWSEGFQRGLTCGFVHR